ncbi:hypothetical protein J6590_071604 [Homalodisca vitripennis]|nr:hypothetical protein J6590_071604 [Homalodisca vitripennis]
MLVWKKGDFQLQPPRPSEQGRLLPNFDACKNLEEFHPLTVIISKSNVQIRIGDENLSLSDTVKTLGVVLESVLCLSDHVTCGSQRALGRRRDMYMLRSILPESIKLRLVLSLVLPMFYYCFPTYGNSISKKDADVFKECKTLQFELYTVSVEEITCHPLEMLQHL